MQHLELLPTTRGHHSGGRVIVEAPEGGGGAPSSKPWKAPPRPPTLSPAQLADMLKGQSLARLRTLYEKGGGRCDGERRAKKCGDKPFLTRRILALNKKALAAVHKAAGSGGSGDGGDGGDGAGEEPAADGGHPGDLKRDNLDFAQRELSKVSFGDFSEMLRSQAASDDERARLDPATLRKMYAGLQRGLEDPAARTARGGQRRRSPSSKKTGGRTLPSEYITRWLGLDREEGPSLLTGLLLCGLFLLQVRLCGNRLRTYGWKSLVMPTGLLRKKQQAAVAKKASAADVAEKKRGETGNKRREKDE